MPFSVRELVYQIFSPLKKHRIKTVSKAGRVRGCRGIAQKLHYDHVAKPDIGRYGIASPRP
jgi:hypothetical protein